MALREGMDRMTEIRWHGRGGQGSVTSAEMVAMAAISEGKYAQAFPSFGAERRGAPILAFNRVSQDPIRIRSVVNRPDIVVVLDPSLLGIMDVTSGLKESGMVIVNTRKSLGEIRTEFKIKQRLATVDAMAIAREVLGLPIVNTAILGALVKASGIIKIESLSDPLRHRFGRAGDKNIEACQRAYTETLVEEI